MFLFFTFIYLRFRHVLLFSFQLEPDLSGSLTSVGSCVIQEPNNGECHLENLFDLRFAASELCLLVLVYRELVYGERLGLRSAGGRGLPASRRLCAGCLGDSLHLEEGPRY